MPVFGNIKPVVNDIKTDISIKAVAICNQEVVWLIRCWKMLQQTQLKIRITIRKTNFELYKQ